MTKILPLVLLGFALSGCGTPQPIKEHAVNTVGLVGELESSLRDFDRVQAIILAVRLKSAASQQASLDFVQRESRLLDVARAANGDTAPTNLLSRINTVAAQIADSDQESKDRNAKADAEFAMLLKPVAPSSEKLTATQKALIPFTKDTTLSTQASEFRSFTKKVKSDVEDNKKKMAAAEASAIQSKE